VGQPEIGKAEEWGSGIVGDRDSGIVKKWDSERVGE